MGQYTIKDVQNRAELLKDDVDNIYRALNDKLGSSPETLDKVPEYILSIPDLPTEESLIITPTIVRQEISGGGEIKYDPITVEPVTSAIDSNIQPENIKEGVTVLGVEGTLKEEKPEERFNVQPTTSDQTITPTAGSVFSGGVVRAVTSSIDNNIQPENIKEGVVILGVAGTLSGGSAEDYINFSGVQSFTENGEFPLTLVDGKYAGNVYINVPTSGSGTAEDYINFSVTQTFNKNGEFPLELIDGKYAGNVYINVPTSGAFVVPDGVKFGYSTFTEVPSNWDFSGVSNAERMFINCYDLTTVSQLNTSNAQNMSEMFCYCENLTTVSQLNTSNVIGMNKMFYNCSNLTTISSLDTSYVLYMQDLFNGCRQLTTIPSLNTSNVQNMDYAFCNCDNLTTVEGIDFSGLTSSPSTLLGYETSKPNLTRFIVNGKINVSISDNYGIKTLTAIDYNSVKSILAAADRTDNTDAKELAFNRTIADQNGELAALVSSCTSKGWEITGLTIE